LHEDFLDDFLGFTAVPEHAQNQAEQQSAMPIVQFANRAGVARHDPIQQVDIGASFLSSLHRESARFYQYSASRRRATTIFSASGKLAFSSTGENGQCVSG